MLGAIKDKERVTGNTAGAFLQCKKQTKPFQIHGEIVDDFYVSLPRWTDSLSSGFTDKQELNVRIKYSKGVTNEHPDGLMDS